MSDPTEPLLSKKNQGPYEASPDPPPYSYNDQPPPAYPAAPEMYNPPISEIGATYQSSMGYQSFCDIDPEMESETTPIISSLSFDDEAVRRGFVRKVFGILTLQLLFTFTVVCVFTFSSIIKEAVQNNIWIYISSFIIFIMVAFPLSFFKSFSRRHPWNIVGLVIVTISFSYMAGTAASFHNTSSVLIAMVATLVISFTIIAFSVQTRFDFSIFYGVLLILVVDFVMFGFFCTFYSSHLTEIGYGCLGALLYALFLMIDCQLMIIRLDPEDYINAALMIYLDIILIFLYLLGRR
uniref:Glutamate receptor, ionotropic, N-methyl D-aspartate-associated protein 1 (Glutamate binding) n=2 Tax=Iconisemion striatum TaxID=60296 RepID=A0A1A7WN13_9TELE